RFAEFNKNLTMKIKERCDELGIDTRIKDQVMLSNGRDIEELGSTELGRLTREKKGRWGGTTVQIPTNMYHTSSETTSYQAVKNYYKILRSILIKNPLTFDIKVD
ncbi:MAG: hypothetical protein AAF182_02085, partial [Pseudomonadota bacterium]